MISYFMARMLSCLCLQLVARNQAQARESGEGGGKKERNHERGGCRRNRGGVRDERDWYASCVVRS